MVSNDRKLIAVIGATGQQGGSVVRALQAGGQFKVRASLAIQASITTSPRKSSRQIWTARKPLNQHLKGPTASLWSPTFGKKVPTSLSRHRRRYALPRMPVSNTLSGRRCLMLKRSAAASSTFRTLPARPRSIDREGSRVCASYVRHRTFLLPEPCGRWLRKSRKTAPWAGLFLSIQLCVAFTWATSPRSAPSWPAHS